jgi:hypothetical protein
MDQIIKKNSFYIGLAGAVMIVALYIYMWQAQDYLNPLLNMIPYILPIILGVVAQVWGRKSMNGRISFKQVVMAYFIAIVMIFLTEAVIYYILLHYLDPGAKEILLDAWRGLSEDQNGLARSDVFKAPTFSLGESALAFATKTLMFTVPGLITGLVISKIPQR